MEIKKYRGVIFFISIHENAHGWCSLVRLESSMVRHIGNDRYPNAELALEQGCDMAHRLIDNELLSRSQSELADAARDILTTVEKFWAREHSDRSDRNVHGSDRRKAGGGSRINKPARLNITYQEEI